MATIEIRKKTSKVWQHVTNDFGTYIVSKMYCKTDGNTFKITEHGGAKRGEYDITEVTIYDDSVGGGAETFATPLLLMKRLEALSYVGFYYDGDVIPADLISTDASNTLILGSDGKLYSAGGGAVAWGAITGTLSSQTDLQDALNLKLNEDFTTLTSATLPLAGTEEIAIVQSGETKKVAVSEIGGGATQYPKVICFQRKNLPNLTGTTAITKMGSFVIPANTIPADCVIRMTLRMANSGTANTKFVYTTWNSISAGANIFSNYVTFTNSTRPELLLRHLGYVSAGTLESYGVSGIYDEIGSTAAYQSFAFDVSVNNEIDIWGKLTDASDTIIFNTLILEILA